MKPSHSLELMFLFVLVASVSGSACECADRRYDDAWESTGVESASAGTTTEAASGGPDLSRFIGVFHNEGYFVPFGVEVEDPGGAILANVEIREDGTAGMTMELCSLDFGTLEIEWRWEPRSDGWIELRPGRGESSLRFMALNELSTLRAAIDEECELRFEVDGDLVNDEVFRPGRACWVNRCEVNGRVHIDLCEGEGGADCS